MFVYVKIQEDELRLIQSFQGDRTMVLSRDYWEAGFKHSNGKGYTLVHISEEEFLPLFYNIVEYNQTAINMDPAYLFSPECLELEMRIINGERILMRTLRRLLGNDIGQAYRQRSTNHIRKTLEKFNNSFQERIHEGSVV